jgi:phage shock protein A
MSIFAKKQDWDRDQNQKTLMDAGPAAAASAASRGSGGHYGIAEAIQLLRGLPVDQNTELVVRVVRATLASLSVHLSDIIEDATRKQKTVQDKIASEHSKVAELEKQLADHRKEIAALEADLKETTTVKERLQMAEKSAGATPVPVPVRGGASPAVVTTLLGNKAPDETHKEARKD